MHRIIALLLIATLAACSSDSSGDAAGDDVPASKCETVPAGKLDAIAEGLKVDGGGSLKAGSALRSPDHSKVFLIAAEVDGPGLTDAGDVGVWMSNSLEPTEGLIYSVDNVAKEFSSWGPVPESVGVGAGDPIVSEARDCL